MSYFKRHASKKEKSRSAHSLFTSKTLIKILLKLIIFIFIVWAITKFFAITYAVIKFRTANPITISLITHRIQEHKEKGQPYSYTFKIMPIEKISSNLKIAIIATEDPNFFSHHGIDFDQLKESFLVDIKERRFTRGASTLTMQTARTLFLSTEKTITRKIQEAIITLIMEIVLSKKRIFELYLNYAELGEGIFGVEAASQYYYHKSSANLSMYQSILLAASISAPHISNCAHPDARLQHRAKVVYNKVRILPPDTKKTIIGK